VSKKNLVKHIERASLAYARDTCAVVTRQFSEGGGVTVFSPNLSGTKFKISLSNV